MPRPHPLLTPETLCGVPYIQTHMNQSRHLPVGPLIPQGDAASVSTGHSFVDGLTKLENSPRMILRLPFHFWPSHRSELTFTPCFHRGPWLAGMTSRVQMTWVAAAPLANSFLEWRDTVSPCGLRVTMPITLSPH